MVSEDRKEYSIIFMIKKYELKPKWDSIFHNSNSRNSRSMTIPCAWKNVICHSVL